MIVHLSILYAFDGVKQWKLLFKLILLMTGVFVVVGIILIAQNNKL